jgi:hypothetical protein
MIRGVTTETRINHLPHPSTSLVAFHSSIFYDTYEIGATFFLTGKTAGA